MKLRQGFIFFLCFILIQSQMALAQGPSSPSTPPNKAPIHTLKNAIGPNGGPITAFYRTPAAGETARVWALNQNLEQIRGTLIDPVKGTIQWDTGSKPLPKGTDRLLPSKVLKHTKWSDEEKRNMRRLTNEAMSGNSKAVTELQSLQNERAQNSGKNLADNRGKIAGVGRTSQVGIALYMAMGLLAYFILARDHSNQPRVWQEFLDSLSDPIGWLMLPAFILASSWVFKMAKDTGGWKGFVVRNAGMAAGLVATSILGKMLADPNLKQCLGFSSHRANGSFVRDEQACDRFYEAWTGEELFLTVVPLVGHAVMAGGMVSALMWMFQKGWNVSGVAQKIKMGARFGQKSTRGSGLISILASGGSMLLFFGAFQLSYQIVDLEHSFRDFFLTKKTLFPREEGDIPTNLKLIDTHFQALQSNQYEEHVPAKECSAGGRSHHAVRQSIKCTGPDLMSQINNHIGLMTSWRSLSHSKAMNAANSWTVKNQSYVENISVTKDVYEVLLRDLSAQRQGQLSPQMNSKEYIGNLETGARSMVNEMAKDINTNADLFSAYTKLKVRDNYDFLLTSMACGPKAGTLTDHWTWTGRVKNTLASPSTPAHMIKNISGRDVIFYPPRLLPDEVENLCANPSPFKLWTPLDLAASPLLPPQRLYGQFISTSGEKVTFKGIMDYLVKTIPQDFTDDESLSFFNNWWNQFVIPSLLRTDETLKEEASEFLTSLKTSFIKTERRCKTSPNNQLFTDLAHFLKMNKLSEICDESSNFRLSTNIQESFVEQLGLYSYLSIKILDDFNLETAEFKELHLNQLQLVKSYLNELFQNESPEQASRLDEMETQMDDLKAQMGQKLLTLFESGKITSPAGHLLVGLVQAMTNVTQELKDYRPLIDGAGLTSQKD